MKRCVLFIMLLLISAIGSVRLQLVAREPGERDAERTEAVSGDNADERIRQFAARFQADDDLTRQFKTALETPTGRVVVKDRAAHISEMLRNEARSDAIPKYVEQYFVKHGDRYELREGNEAYRKQFLEKCSTFNIDVQQIQSVLNDMAANMSDETELDRLVTRFMKHEGAPAMLYVERLRDRIRPDENVVQRALGEVFVADENYEYMIRAGRQAEAEETLERLQGALKGVKPLRAEFVEWSKEFAETDDLNKRAKTLLADPMFATFIAAQIFKEPGDVERRLDQFFENFGKAAVDTADGLAIVEDEHREELGRAFDKYDRLHAVAVQLRGPTSIFASKIRKGNALEEGWRELLMSDLVALKLADEFEVPDADAGQAIRQLLGELLEKGSDGKLHVSTAESEEEIADFIREMFRMYRNVRRRARAIDEVSQQIGDPEMAKALATLGGKYVVLHSIQQSMVGAEFDGLNVWIREHCESVGDGFVIRPEAREELVGILEDVKQVERELENDDF